MSTLDKSKIKPIPTTKTLVLINNFIANTTVFFNNFTEVVEDKISKLSNKITDVEILLAVLEAKLNSIPGLDHIEAAKPPPTTSTTNNTTTSTANTASASTTTPAAPASSTTVAPTTQASESAAAVETAPVVEEAPKEPSLADDPAYQQFFKLLKVGVPVFVVQAKAAAAGLDPSVFENYQP